MINGASAGFFVVFFILLGEIPLIANFFKDPGRNLGSGVAYVCIFKHCRKKAGIITHECSRHGGGTVLVWMY